MQLVAARLSAPDGRRFAFSGRSCTWPVSRRNAIALEVSPDQSK
jgi:hypothetical protein